MIKKEELLVRNPLESNFSLTELIKPAKALPGIRDINIRVEADISKVSRKIDVESSVLRIGQVKYTDGEIPIMYNQQYWIDGIGEFPVLRRRNN